MPRRQRIGSGGLIFDVINRGAKRSCLFENASDYSACENLIAESRRRVQIPLLAYCLMPNHWHDDHFLRVCRYVERNPLRAGLVKSALEWRWCICGVASSFTRTVC